MVEESKEEGTVPQVSSLPKMAQGRPLLLGQELDKSVQDYINAMRKVGGVVNTAIVMAAANGIIAARSPAFARTVWWSHRHNQSMGQISANSDGLCQEKVFQCWKDYSGPCSGGISGRY